jgi:drug/metabolite transporter (DMT)-like permease
LGTARVASAQISPVADVRTERVILVLADISGYTRFVKSHRCSHACAEHVVRELLKAVIDCAEPPLHLRQLLGDAAVFYAVSDGSTALAREMFDQVQRICKRFRERASGQTGRWRRCTCHAARDASTLKLKVIVHHGDAVFAPLGGVDNLIGENVILAHRLLKNSIPADEYILATDAFQQCLGDTVSRPAEGRRERCDGIGGVAVTVYYSQRDRPASPRSWLRSRLARPAQIAANALRGLLGPNRPVARHRRRPRALGPENVPRRHGLTAARPRARRGVTLVFVSAACFGALGVLTQLAYRAGVPVLGLLWGRYLLAAAVLWLVVVALRRPLPTGRGLLFGMALGAGYSVQALLFATSLKHLQAGLADLLYFAYPALVAVGATALARERWSRRRGAALVAASAGIGLALAGGSTVDPLGVVLALGAALGCAAYVLVSSSLLKGIDSLMLAALLCSAAAIVLGADALAHGELAPRVGLGGLLLVATIALVSTVLGIGAFLAGVRRLGPSRASIVSSVEPALTATFGFAAFGDRFGLIQLLGAGLVLASVPILELRLPAVGPVYAKTFPVLAGLTWHERMRVMRNIREVHITAGTQLFAQGAHARDFFLIRRGTATMLQNGAHLANLGPGDFFGEGAPLGIKRRRASVTAASDMSLLVVQPRGFQPLQSTPRIASRLRQAMHERAGALAGAAA